MTGLTDEAMRRVADWLTGKTVTQFEAPFHLRVITSDPTSSTPGTECTGSTYVRKSLTYPAANTAGSDSTVTKSEASAQVWSSLDPAVAVGVRGYEVWDAGNTRVGYWTFDFGTVVTVPAGQEFRIDTDTLPRFAVPTFTTELDAVVEKRGMDFLVGRTGVVQPTGPLQVRLMAFPYSSRVDAGGEQTAPLYARQGIAFADAVIESGVAVLRNTAQVTWAGLDPAQAVGISGVEVWDSAAVPKRLWFDKFANSISVPAGLGFHIPAGGHTLKVG